MTTRPAPDADGRAERSVGKLQAQRLLASTMLVLLPVLLVALLWTAQKAIFLLFAGMLFAALLDAATRGLVGIAGLPRKWAYAAVMATLLVLLAALIWLGGSALVAHVGDLYAALQEQLHRLGDVLGRIEPGPQQGGRETLLTTLRDLGSIFRGGGGGPASMALSVLGAFANAFIVFFLGLFLALNPGLYRRGAVRLFPPERRGRIDEALDLAGQTLRWWLVGKLMSMTVISVLTLVGLLLVGYPLALPLALVAGLLAFVPNLGPLVAYVPIVLAGIPEGATTILLGIVSYAVAQTIESYVLTPLIQNRMVSLPPALLLFAQILGGILFGLWGVALATPLTAVLHLWVRRYYVRQTLERETPEADPEVDDGDG